MTSRPIFVLGISPRSGTNFLFNLLRLHPACEVPAPLWEDYVLEPAHLLAEYVRSVGAWWRADPAWGVTEEMERAFCRHLGDAIVSFLASRADGKRLLTKTPTVAGLEYFADLFPEAYLLILVRDGRDVVESGARSFGWDRDVMARKWAEAAETIVSFDRASPARPTRRRIVRYEDLWADLEGQLRELLDFLELELSAYDFEGARELPVWGSSTHQGAEGGVHWQPVDKGRDFKPVRRWERWSRRQHERFNWIAGPALGALGYEAFDPPGQAVAWSLYNHLVDANQRYGVFRAVPPAMKAWLKGMWGRLFG
jgi:hypothetical protein